MLVVLENDDFSPARVNAEETAGGVEAQISDIGGDDGTANWQLQLRALGGFNDVWWGLKAQRDNAADTVDAVFVLAATDEDGDERTLTFSTLRWQDLTHKSAPDFTNRFVKINGEGFYREIGMNLLSEA